MHHSSPAYRCPDRSRPEPIRPTRFVIPGWATWVCSLTGLTLLAGSGASICQYLQNKDTIYTGTPPLIALAAVKPYHTAEARSRYEFLLRCRPLRHVFVPDGWQN